MKFTPTLPQEENFIPIVNMFFLSSQVLLLGNKKKRGSISLTIFCLHRENFLFTHPKPQAKQMAICFFLHKFCFKSLLYTIHLFTYTHLPLHFWCLSVVYTTIF